jgi:N-acetyl-anhydromuramyl-L-alanine amidase AmpD
MRELDKIIIHCSDSDIESHDNVETIRRWHLERGWSDIGYHYYIKKDGTIDNGRPIEVKGSHCYGYNTGSIGICLGGRYSFTEEQFGALRYIIVNLIEQFGNLEIFGHYELSTKTCPNFNVADFLDEYRVNDLIKRRNNANV